VGKARCLATLAAMPANLRARAPVGRMLERAGPGAVRGHSGRSSRAARPGAAGRLGGALLDPSAPPLLASPWGRRDRVLPRGGQRVRRDGICPKSRGCRRHAAERGQQAWRL